MKKLISWEDFEKIDMRIGTITKVEKNEAARNPAYKFWLDLGELGEKVSSGQFTALYEPQDLVGKQAICVVNFPVKKIAGFRSEVLVTGLYGAGGEITLVTCDKPVANGAKLG
jgi:tRNA-binding protein